MPLLIWALAITALCYGVYSEDKVAYYPQQWAQTFSVDGLNNNALFGYSVAYQKTLDRLVIGSPRASENGKLYTCPAKTGSGQCSESKVNWKRAIGKDFWLGATVNAGKDFIMACAPRYLAKSDQVLDEHGKNENAKVGTFGRCYYLMTTHEDISLDLSMMSIVKAKERNEYHSKAYPSGDKVEEHMFDSFGWSSHVSQESILVGGPAMSIGRAMLYSRIGKYPNLFFVVNDGPERARKQISYNFGYSLTSGKFNGDDKWYAISSPYGKGRVVFYSYSNVAIDLDLDVVGEFGTLFGAALGSMRTDNNRDALLVGAPCLAPRGASAEHEGDQSYDVGALYVYCYSDERFELRRKLLGYKDGSYFGSAVASIGDRDHDKIDEIVVAAPYENDGRGAVYIYSGKQLLDSTVREVKFLQKIAGGNKDHYLGWSLFTTADADDNGCSALAIGNPGGNSVTLLHCLANVEVSFSGEFPNLMPQYISLQTKQEETSFKYKPCLKVSYSDPVEPKTIETEILITITLNDHPNVEIQNAVKRSISFKQSLKPRLPKYCKEITVLLPKNGDYDYPIEFTMTAALVKDPLEVVPFNPQLVSLSGHTTLTTTVPAVSLPKSNLTFNVATTLKDGYVVGTTDDENVMMKIVNLGNDAFKPCIRLKMEGLEWENYPHNCSFSEWWLTCGPDNIVKGDSSWNATAILNTKNLTSAITKIQMQAELLTRCRNRILEPYNKTISLKHDTNIVVNGISSPSSNVEVTRQVLQETGKQVEHIYYIKNNGSTTWKDLICHITLPADVDSFVYMKQKDDCKVNGTKAVCVVKSLKKNGNAQIRIQMDIQSDSILATNIKKGSKVELKTFLTLSLASDVTRQISAITTFSLWKDPAVPLWIIVVAGLVGLLILVILTWVLHECGFLRRNKKEELKEFKKEIARQSMRISMMRHSTILPKENERGERQPLVEVAEEGDTISQDGVVDNQPKSPFTMELAQAVMKNNNRNVTTNADCH